MTSKLENSFTRIVNKKSFRYILLGIITIVFITSYRSIYDEKPDMNGDNIYYFALGKALTEGKGFTNIMSFYESPHTHFPPGYPLFVAGVMKFFPDSMSALKIANGVLLYLSLMLLFFLIKRLSGDILIAFFTCILSCLHGELLRYSTIVMSEMLFFLCTVCSLYLVLSIDVKKLFTPQGIGHSLMLLALGVLISYTYLVRTMGTSLILAVILYTGIIFLKYIYEWWKEKKSPVDRIVRREAAYKIVRQGIICLFLFAAFYATKAGWDARNRQAGKAVSDYIHDFKKKSNGQVMTTWEDWSGRIERNFNSYLTKWVPNAIMNSEYDIRRPSTAGEWFKGICIAGLILLGLFKLREGSLLLFLYLGATMAVLLVWPEQYGGLRYFVTTIPLFIFLFLNGIKEGVTLLLQKMNKKRSLVFWPVSLVAVFVVLFMFPPYTLALKDQKIMAKFKTGDVRIGGPAFSEYIAASQWCSENLPDTARVVCRKPEIFYLYSGGEKAASFSYYGKPDEIYKQLVDLKATHVIIDHWFRHAYYTLYPVIVKYYPEHFRPVCQFGGRNPQKELPTLIFEFNPEPVFKRAPVDSIEENDGK